MGYIIVAIVSLITCIVMFAYFRSKLSKVQKQLSICRHTIAELEKFIDGIEKMSQYGCICSSEEPAELVELEAEEESVGC